jgi:hypothetical protein
MEREGGGRGEDAWWIEHEDLHEDGRNGEGIWRKAREDVFVIKPLLEVSQRKDLKRALCLYKFW